MDLPAEEHAKANFINPFYVVVFAEHLFGDQGTAVAKEDWVLANTKLLQEMGASDWLRQLLVNLTTEPTDDLTQMVMNPRQAVVFSNRLKGEHKPMIDEPAWIAANAKLINELGAEEWFWRLLDILETGGLPA